MLLYIHIPFCDSKCHYCSFNSYVDKHTLIARYMQALLRQLKHELTTIDEPLQTLFIGGGTPSCVPASLYAPIFEVLQGHPLQEITVEANPNSATPQWLQSMQRFGVTRVSLGVQSFDDTKLKKLGRAHQGLDTVRAVAEVANAGIAHCSVDLIYGNSFDTPQLITSDIQQALALEIDHLSAYALTIEEGTVFEKQPHLAHDNAQITMTLFEQLSAAGFRQYEISNFGRYQSLHNRGYWQQHPYLGIGAGAVGCKKQRRYYPHKEIEAYIQAPTTYHYEKISDEDWLFEHIFLGLRSDVGVTYEKLTPKMRLQADILLKENRLLNQASRLYNPDFLLSDELALFITQP